MLNSFLEQISFKNPTQFLKQGEYMQLYHQLLFQQIQDGIFSLSARPDQAQFNKVRYWLQLYGYSNVWYESREVGWRIYMEDGHIDQSPLSDKKNSLFGVFDGHGGPEVAVFVERNFVKELEANKNYQNKEYEKALKETFLKMDQILLTQNGKKQIVAIQNQMRSKDNGPKYEEQSHAGCTANVILITPDYIYCANAGDSRSVACIKGETKELSKDHKPQDAIELDRIKKAGGTVSFGRVNGGLNLSRALGDMQYKNSNLKPQEQMITPCPDILKIKNQNIDFIIMGCDGIWQVKNNDEMVKWIAARIEKNLDSKNILQELLDSLVSKDSNSQYGMDNMSAILIRYEKKK